MDVRVIILVFFLVLVTLCNCQKGPSTLAEQLQSRKKLCGQNLSTTLSAVCKGVYNTLNKKDEIYSKKSYWDPEPEYPFTRKKRAISMMNNFRRKKRGVYNECCEKPCAHSELVSYCA